MISVTPPRRNRYFYGKLRDELHLRMEQEYFNGKRWMLNRLALGRGALCGLAVTADGKTVWMASGVAIDGLGREIVAAPLGADGVLDAELPEAFAPTWQSRLGSIGAALIGLMFLAVAAAAKRRA